MTAKRERSGKRSGADRKAGERERLRRERSESGAGTERGAERGAGALTEIRLSAEQLFFRSRSAQL